VADSAGSSCYHGDFVHGDLLQVTLTVHYRVRWLCIDVSVMPSSPNWFGIGFSLVARPQSHAESGAIIAPLTPEFRRASKYDGLRISEIRLSVLGTLEAQR
jgi:hypothetical protein